MRYGGTYPDTTFLSYDPPYNAKGTSWLPSSFPSIFLPDTADAIVRARAAGIQGSAETISWTDGYNNPNDPNVQRLHSKFNVDSTALNRIAGRPKHLVSLRSRLSPYVVSLPLIESRT